MHLEKLEEHTHTVQKKSFQQRRAAYIYVCLKSEPLHVAAFLRYCVANSSYFHHFKSIFHIQQLLSAYYLIQLLPHWPLGQMKAGERR